jgi:hypothetical protein
MSEPLKPGRKAFHELLRAHARGLVARVVREQLTHAQYLSERDRIYASAAFAQSTSMARVQLNTYLEGAIDMLHTTGQVVWKHRLPSGEWVDSPAQALRPRATAEPAINYREIDPNASQFLWSDSNRPWFGPQS